MNRREFMLAGAAGMAFAAGARVLPGGAQLVATADENIRGVLIHMGMNM